MRLGDAETMNRLEKAIKIMNERNPNKYYFCEFKRFTPVRRRGCCDREGRVQLQSRGGYLVSPELGTALVGLIDVAKVLGLMAVIGIGLYFGGR